MKIKTYIPIVLYLVLSTLSCVPVEKLSYLNDIEDIQEPAINPRTQKLIMPFDKLYIRVISIDPQANEMFSQTDELRIGGSGASGLLGYLVDETGNVYFPFVGEINVLSLTTNQASEKIQNALNDYVPNTSVTVKYVDNQVTVIGEVQRQGVFPFNQDKLNIYEAIGLSGGISRYGDRKRIILIRQEGTKTMHYKINLSDSKIASKNTYYIHPNDVIVVEPLKALSNSYTNNTYNSILSSITTFLAILLFIGVRR